MNPCKNCPNAEVKINYPWDSKTHENKVPFKCPVCMGRGIVDAAFYMLCGGSLTESAPIPCKSCNNGIIWG